MVRSTSVTAGRGRRAVGRAGAEPDDAATPDPATPAPSQAPGRRRAGAWHPPDLATIRDGAALRTTRVRSQAEPILQTALAAGVAWLLAVVLLGAGRAFFAPIAAMIVLGLAPGRRIVRSLQVVVGISIGVLIGEVAVGTAGVGVPQIVIVAIVAFAIAAWLDPAPLFASQVAVSAVLVVTLEPLVPGSAPVRILGAVIGGLVGLAVLGLTSRDPERAAGMAMSDIVHGLALRITEVRAALRAADARGARDAQARAADALPAIATLPDAVARAREPAVLRARRSSLGRMRRHEDATAPLATLGNDVVVLARSAARTIELGEPPPPALTEAIDLLAHATRALGRYLRSGRGVDEIRRLAVHAVAVASAATSGGTSLPVGGLAGAVRSVGADLLRVTGLDPAEIAVMLRAGVDALDPAAGDPAQPVPGAGPVEARSTR
jgi:hypothetical protein